jgi:hypothetical protein
MSARRLGSPRGFGACHGRTWTADGRTAPAAFRLPLGDTPATRRRRELRVSSCLVSSHSHSRSLSVTFLFIGLVKVITRPPQTAAACSSPTYAIQVCARSRSVCPAFSWRNPFPSGLNTVGARTGLHARRGSCGPQRPQRPRTLCIDSNTSSIPTEPQRAAVERATATMQC